MNVITVNGNQYLAAAVATEEGVTTISGALAFSGSSISAGVISTYLQKKNVGELTEQSLAGMQAYQTRELTSAENIAVKHAEAQFELAKEVAIPRLQNSTFADIQSGM